MTSARLEGTPRATAALILASLVAGLMQTVIVPIQSDLPALLGESRNLTAWVITATLLGACAFAPITGRLGDLFGRTQVAIALMLVLALGSVIAAIAPDVWWLIVGRGLQGVAIGIIPMGISILRDVVSPIRLGGVVALASGTLGIGSALGLPIGAAVAELWSWRGIFWVAALLSLLSAIHLWWAVPRIRAWAVGRFDYVGAAGVVIGTAGLIIALSQGFAWGWISLPTLAAFAAGLVVLALTLRLSLRHPSPIIDVRAALTPAVLMTNLASAMIGFSMMGATIVFPQILALPRTTEAGLGLGLVPASLIMMAAGVASALAVPGITRYSARFGAKMTLVTGALVTGTPLAAAVFGMSNEWSILAANVVIGVGMGMSFAAMPQVIMRVVSPENIAASNGLNVQMRTFGTSSSAAVCGAVLAHWATGSGTASSPTLFAFQVALWLSAGAAVAGALFSLRIPSDRDESDR